MNKNDASVAILAIVAAVVVCFSVAACEMNYDNRRFETRTICIQQGNQVVNGECVK